MSGLLWHSLGLLLHDFQGAEVGLHVAQVLLPAQQVLVQRLPVLAPERAVHGGRDDHLVLQLVDLHLHSPSSYH